MKNNKILFLTQFSILLAIEAIFCFTPLGSIPAIGPIVATLGMIPVVITAVVLGTTAGTMMGFFAGLFSFLVWTFMPPVPIVAFVFTPFYSVGTESGNFLSLVICFVPRILVGTVTGLTFSMFRRMFNGKKELLSYGLSGALGSLTNTFLVLGGVYLFFGKTYAEAIGESFSLLLGVIGLQILTSGIPEAVISFVSAYFIGYPINKFIRRKA